MKNKYKILSIIPARGGSKGVRRKNIKSLCGKPLLYYTIKAGLDSKYIDRIVVSTEDNEISAVAIKYNVEVIKRPKELARDDTPSVPVFQHVLKYLEENDGYEPDIVVILQPTSPLREVQDIDACIKKLVSDKCDSIMSVKKVDHPPQWLVKLDGCGRIKPLFENKKITRRQDVENIYIPNGAVFVTWKDIILEKNTIDGPDTRAFIMPPDRSIDIDTELDFYTVQQIAKGRLHEMH